MDSLKETIKDYLSRESEYALLITGGWGQGKTFYLKNVVLKEIGKGEGNFPSRKPIMVSLAGVRSIEELQGQILLEIHPYLKGKVIEISSVVGKTLAKGYLAMKGLLSIGEIGDKALSDGKKVAKSNLSFKDLVICLDDLERKSTHLQTEELVGFINSILLNENAKVILICNEERFEGFKPIKEKIIRTTVEFSQDSEKIVDDLVQFYFGTEKVILGVLQTHRALIMNVFVQSSKNLRTLHHGLEVFRNINSQLELNRSDDRLYQERKGKIQSILLRFVLAITVEFKEGQLDYNDSKGLDMTVRNMDISKASNSQLLYFLNKYGYNLEFIFFENIYNHITGGHPLQIELTVQRLNEEGILPKEENAAQLAFEILGQPWQYSEYEWSKARAQTLKHLKNGDYSLDYYPSLFTHLLFNAVTSDTDFDKIEKLVIAGMRRMKSKEHLPYFDEIYGKDRSKDKYSLKNIKEQGARINKQLEIKLQSEIAKNLFDLWCKDAKSFSKTVLGSGDNARWPVLSYFSVSRFFNQLVANPIEGSRVLHHIITTRYLNNGEVLYEEQGFINGLYQKIEARRSNKAKDRKFAVGSLRDLSQELKKIDEYLIGHQKRVEQLV